MGECENIPSTVERYRERFARVLAHIEGQSESLLSINDLSGVAAFSRHHFHRQFSGFLGMSAYRYVQFMRMRRASWRMAFRPELSVNQVALATGYEGPEAFARIQAVHRSIAQRVPLRTRLGRVAFPLQAVRRIEEDNHGHSLAIADRARDYLSGNTRGEARAPGQRSSTRREHPAVHRLAQG